MKHVCRLWQWQLRLSPQEQRSFQFSGRWPFQSKPGRDCTEPREFSLRARWALHRDVCQILGLPARGNTIGELFGFPSAPSECSGQRREPAPVAEAPCHASCSSALSSSSASTSAGRSFKGGPMASAATEIIEAEATEETSGGCRRSEPTGETARAAKSQPARSTQDSDDSDDDPILIPPSRLSEQGQRYPPNAFTATLFSPYIEILLYFWYIKLFFVIPLMEI